MTYIDEKEKTNVLVNRTKKRKYNDIEDDVKDEMVRKFEQEKERNIRMNCLKLNEGIWYSQVAEWWIILKTKVIIQIRNCWSNFRAYN